MGLLSKIAGKFGFMTRTDIDKVISDYETKSASEFGRLWLMARESKIFGNSVTKPYEQISSVYKAVKAISDNVPQAELKFYRKGGKDEILNDDVVNLLNHPNPYMSESEFVQAVTGFIALYDEAIIIKQQSIGQAIGKSRLPAELWVFNPSDFIEVIDQQTRRIVGWRYKGGIDFKSEDVIHIKGFNPYNQHRSLNPISSIKQIIDIDWQSLVFNKAFFDNDAMPGLVLSSPDKLNPAQIERIRTQWETRHRGASNAHKVAIMESGLEPKSVTPNHKDMEFIEQKKFTREEILGIWRVPKSMFSITDDLNYATFIGQQKMFWNYTIMPILKKIQSNLNRHLVDSYNPGLEIRFDFSNVVAYQEDFKEKVTTASSLFAMGFTGNEINDKLELGFKPAEWRDYWWVTFGMTPADGKTAIENNKPVEPAPVDNQPAKEPNKSFDETRKMAIWKTMLSRQVPVESRFASSIKRYFFEQRIAFLKHFNEYKQVGGFDWQTQDKILKDKASQYLWLAIQEGVKFAGVMINRTKSLLEEDLNHKLQSYLTVRADKVTMINETVKNRISDTLAEGIANGEAMGSLADRIKDVYNMASSRSLLISRTETIGAFNGGSHLFYVNEGISRKEWLTARDELVRESHQRLEGVSVIVGQSYPNGCKYPGDQDCNDPAEVCNCRCTEIPLAED